MGKIIIQEETTKNPLEIMGREAGICYGSDISNPEKNSKRGKTCLANGHGRLAEFPQVYMTIEGYSARVIRELYTHIGGAPTRVQASTRYIKYGEFDYITPPSIANNENCKLYYDKLMTTISEAYKAFESADIPKEDIANILPLGMTTTIVFRTNLRNLIDMSHQRLCTRAYWEYRQLMRDIMTALKAYSPEWEYLVNTYFKRKCEVSGYCLEHKCCGYTITKEEYNRRQKDINDKYNF